MSLRAFEIDVHDTKLRMLRMAHDRDLDSAVLVAALADVLGHCAATLDAHVGASPFETRMDEVITRAKAAYLRTTTAMAARRS